MKHLNFVNRYAFSSYYFYIKKSILKIIWSNAYFFYNIEMCYTIFMVFIWKYLRVLNKIYIDIKEYLKRVNQ